MATSKPLGSDTQGNFQRANLAIIQIHSEILRDDLERFIRPETIDKAVRGSKIKIAENLIKDAVIRKSYSKFDITLLYTIFRNCGKTSTPSKGWNAAPDATDISFEDDLERIRLMRNKLFHSTVAELPDDEFNEMWNEMFDICGRADKRIPGNFYSVKLCNLKVASLDKVTEEKLNVLEEEGIKDPLEIAIEKKGNTVQKWEENEACFFQTRASKAIQCRLQNNPVVTVVGRSGTGKTFTCQQIANSYKRRGWITLPVYTVDELLILINPGSRHQQLYILDDPLGKESLDEMLLNNFIKSAKSLQEYLEHSQNIKLMITSRYVVEHGTMNFNNIVIDSITLRLSDDEKRGIMSKYESSWGLDENDRREIIQTDDYFPLLCSMYKNNGAFRKYGKLFFKNPRHILEKELRICKTMHKEQHCALLLLAVNNGCLTKDFFSSDQERDKSIFANICELSCLSKHTPRISVMNQLNSSLGNLIAIEENNFKFRHDYILETVTLIFGGDFPKDMLKLCPVDFICHNVALKGTYSEKNSKAVLQIGDDLIGNLIQRIFSEFRNGTCLPVCFSNLLHNDKLISAICKNIQALEESDFQAVFLTIHKNSSSLTDVARDSAINLEAFDDHWNGISSEKFDFFSKLEKGTEDNIRQVVKMLQDYVLSLLHQSENQTTYLGSFSVIFLKDPDMLDEAVRNIYKGGVTEKNKQAFESFCQFLHSTFQSEFKNFFSLYFNQMHFGDDSCKNTEDGENLRIYLSLPNLLKIFPKYLRLPDIKKFKICQRRKSLKSQLTLFAPTMATSICLAFTGHKEIFDCILKRIRDEKWLHSCKELKLLISSCAVGSLGFVKSCLGDFDPNLLDEKWRYQFNFLNLFHCSAIFHQPKEMKLLLEYGVDVNECDILGNSALHLATDSFISDEINLMKAGDKCEEIVQLLLEHKADVNLKNLDRRTPVHLAAQANHIRVLQLLLQHDGNEDEKDCYGWSPLHYACKIGLVFNIDCLLKHGKKKFLNDKTNSGETALLIASKFGRAAAVIKLLEYHADVNVCDDKGKTPLLVAVAQGHEAVVTHLAKHKADVNIGDSSGTTPLMIASYCGYIGIAKILIKNNANVNASSSSKSWTSLHFASLNHNESIVELLLENMADATMRGRNGDTALMQASYRGFSNITEILLRYEADVNAVNNNKDTALTLASDKGHFTIVQQLLNFLKETNRINLNKKHALCLFKAAANGHISVVEELITYKVNINQSTEKGETPLIVSSDNQHYEVVDILLRKGAKVNLYQRDGMTALYFAAKNGNEKIVKLLLKNKADFTICDNFGNSPLHTATQYGRLNIIKCLTEYGADPNLQNNRGRNIAHIAAIYGQENIVSFLLSQQWYSDVEDSHGLTAIFLAAACGHKKVVERLLRHWDNVDKQNSSNQTLLMTATVNGQFEVVEFLLKEGQM